jgi:antitoxin component YwqK of YwqJK toxin-antitoxin module
MITKHNKSNFFLLLISSMNYKLLSKPQFLKMYLWIVFSINAFPLFSQKPQLIVPNQNQLYMGIDNQCYLKTFDQKNYVIKALDSNCLKISMTSENEFTIDVRFFMKENAVMIGLVNNNNVNWLDTQFFKITYLPKPEPYVENIRLKYNQYSKENNLEVFPERFKLIHTTHNKFFDEKLGLKITKFRLIVASDNSVFTEFESNSDTLSQMDYEKLISIIKPNDIILIEGIYAEYKKSLRLLHPLVLKYKPYNYINTLFDCEYLIQGYVRNKGELYNYNSNRINFYKSEADTLMKDSLWKYSHFNIEKRQFECYQMDSFSNNKLIKSYFWNHKNLSIVEYINDTLGELKHYYENGKLYQKGNVLINSKFLNYTYLDYVTDDEYDWHWCTSIQDTVYTPHINTIEGSLYPTGKWQIFYPNGKLNIELNFTQKEIEESYLNKQKYYQIIPTGECLIYDEKGKLIQKINYSNPKN